jgi:predicted nucleic acid-binding protein
LISLVVSDAGPLIALSRIGRLSLLSGLFETVSVPGIVVRELRLDEPRAGVAPLAAAMREQTWLRSVDLPAERSIPGLDAGESAAIRLAGTPVRSARVG